MIIARLNNCRALEYVCSKSGSPSSVCNFNVVNSETNPRPSKDHIMLSPYPLTVGRLLICRTADFRKAHRIVNPGHLECGTIYQVRRPRTVGPVESKRAVITVKPKLKTLLKPALDGIMIIYL